MTDVDWTNRTGKSGNQADPAKCDDIPDIDAAQKSAADEAALLDRRDDDLLPDKPRDAEIFSVIARKIRERRAFGENFAVVSSDGGKTATLVEVDADNVCTPVRRERVADLIVCWGDRNGKSTYRLEPRKAMECAKYWYASVDRMLQPATALWPGEEGLCYHRYPFARAVGPTPLWDDVNRRMDYPHEFNLWVGSLFRPSADRSQYVWLYGNGGEGKSEVIRALEWTFGTAGLVLNALPRPRQDNFWSEVLPGKRFIGCSDVSSKDDELRLGEFKSLVGGDTMMINPKGKPKFSIRSAAKILCASNHLPQISKDRADQRRIILVHMQPYAAAHDPDYHRHLCAELPAYVQHCIALYDEFLPDHGLIPMSEAAKASAFAAGIDYDDVHEDFHVAKFYTEPEQPGCKRRWLDSERMEHLLRERWPNNVRAQREHKNWLLRTHGIGRRDGVGDNRKRKGYFGLVEITYPGHDEAQRYYANQQAERTV